MAVEFGLIALPPVPSGVQAPLLTITPRRPASPAPCKPPCGDHIPAITGHYHRPAGGGQLCRRVLRNRPVRSPRSAVEPKPATGQIGHACWRGLLPDGRSAGADQRGQQHRGNHDTASIRDISPHKGGGRDDRRPRLIQVR